ncbi:MAG: hypothetical protein KJ077_39240 [Anaerolineae bacterium]|nr:hypothetical protein [Anaerolineae bacterium]
MGDANYPIRLLYWPGSRKQTEALGLTQAQLWPGAFHWVIQLIHLVVGLAAMGLGDRLAQMSKHSLSPAL